MSLASALPDFPWDTLAGAKAQAARHERGLIDLSVGTPVDPTPNIAQEALATAADSPGYPLTAGTRGLQEAIAAYFARRWNVRLDAAATLPVIGTKELVAWLPTLLGFGRDDIVVIPETAYPTYAVGALIAGCQVLPADSPDQVRGKTPALIWLNSPSNPTGRITPPEELAMWVACARSWGAVLAADECYAEFGWDGEPVSILNPQIAGADQDHLLAVHSLSKRSNLAGYRAGFVAGDQRLISELLAVRKHAGMMVPGPVQQAMIALLADQQHVDKQRERYLARRSLLRPALEDAGFTIDHSEGSIYLWASRGEECRATVDFLADLGILVAPGDFYGESGKHHVRLALTARDDQIEEAARRLRR